MKKKLLLVVLLFGFVLSAQSDVPVVYKDTVVAVGIDFTELTGALNGKKVEKAFYKHFREKGFLIEKELDFGTFDPELAEHSNKNAVSFIDLHAIPNRKGLAIISYYNCQPFANGNWVLPEFALAVRTKEGIEIRNAGFVPAKYCLDRVADESGISIYISASDYVKTNAVKHYRILLR